jgi:hypothetical protein
MDRPASHPHFLKSYLALNAAATLAAGALMRLLAGNAGYSRLRSIPIEAAFVLGVAALAVAILLHLRPAKERALHDAIFTSRRTRRIQLALSLLFLVLWCLTWLPPNQTAAAHDYFIALYPLILCGLLASGSGIVFVLAPGADLSASSWRKWLRERRRSLSVALIALAAFALIAFLTVQLHILTGHEPLWYGAGVPLLSWQVLITAIAALVTITSLANRSRSNAPSDRTLFLLVWLVAAVFWAARPIAESYWVTGPRPPNWEFYPFSDLVTFDLGSQFALIGQGINNRLFFDRGLYMSFLVLLHSAGGQDYQRLMAIQAAIFAVFPALLYLIGRKLHSRTAGLILSAFTTMRGVNSLSAAAWIDTATFKHMLTDFPTAIGLAVFVLLVLAWLEAPPVRWRHALWAGGALGLTSLLRPHVLLLAPVLALVAAWLYPARWSRRAWLGGLTLIAFFAGVAPWMFLGPGSGSIIGFYGARVRAVIATRYPPRVSPPAALPAPTSAIPVPPVEEGQPASPPAPTPPGKVTSASAVYFVVPQYLHNLVTSGLIFPDSPQFLSIRETVKSGEEFWRPRWGGAMSPLAAGMLVLNLAAVAIGLGAVFQRLRWRGLLPVAVLLIYNVANAFARSSGGRYLVPTDWILVGYYAVGLTTVLHTARLVFNGAIALPATPTPAKETATAPSWPRALVILVGLVLIGALVPLAGVVYPRRYPQKDAPALLAEIAPQLPKLGQTSSDLTAFLQQPGAVALYGRALYPRFYPQGVGEPTRYAPYGARDYPRMVFVLIGPQGTIAAMLPGRGISALPNASDVILLGCKSRPQGYDLVNALLVVLPREGIGYARSPAAPLTCPLPEPVCDNNKNCH